MRFHLRDSHSRYRRVSPVAWRRQYVCDWDACGQTFPNWIAAAECFHKHQAIAFAAAAAAAAPAQEQQQQQD